MRVMCVASSPSPEQARRLGAAFRAGRTTYPVTGGIEYVALGLGFWDGVAWVEISMETEAVVSIPLFLFEITDPRPSSLWEVRSHSDGGVTLWPREFYEPLFHDYLSDGRSDEVAALRKIQRHMRDEMA